MTCRKGLTLIELLVALAITGLMMVGGYGALSTMVDHRTRVMEATDHVASAAAKRRLLVGLLRGARLTVSGDATFEGLDGISDDRADDVLTFLTNAPTSLGTSEAVVQVYIDRDPKTSVGGLSVMLTDRRSGTTKRMEIDARATRLDIHYLSGAFGKRAWLDSWVSTTVLPSGARLVVASDQPESLPSLLRPAIVVPFGSVQ